METMKNFELTNKKLYDIKTSTKLLLNKTLLAMP